MTNIPEEDKAHSRFHSWAALAILSIVAVLAITQNPNNATNFEENWSLGCVFASLAVAAIACICHGIRKSRDAFVGSIVEAILIVIAVIVWIMALPIIMSPNRSLAINNLNIVDANLYFSAWGCIALALYIAGSWIEERGYHPYADRLAKRWFLLFVSSIVAMGVSSRIFSINNCRDSGNEICDELSSSSNNTVVAAYATIPYLRRVRPVWNAASVGGETSSRTTPQGNRPRPIIPNTSCASLASRPLVDGHLQPILWKFGSRRHYNHIERKVEAHDIPWAQKLDRAVFRGSLTGRMPMDRPEREVCRSMPRCNLVWQHANSTLVDAKLSKLDGRPLPNMLDGVLLTGAALSQQELLQFKALIMLEGNDVSTGLKWALLSNSLVLMPPPTVTSWAMEEWLQPYVHYVPLLPDLSNAEAQMRWILAHDRDAQQIALRGKLWMQDLLFHPQATEDNAAINQEIMRRYRGLFQVVPSEG
jgi:hypothetical protein